MLFAIFLASLAGLAFLTRKDRVGKRLGQGNDQGKV